MQNTMPHFKYHHASVSNGYVASIEAEGKFVHRISNLDDFYRAFGYTKDMRRDGLLPDEFIWDEYINNPIGDFTACCQMHLIEYLKKHSDLFVAQYGNKIESWCTAHAEVRAKRGVACAACRMEPLCSK